MAFFKAQGYLALRDFIDAEQVANWRRQFWRHLGADPADASTWPDDYVIKDFSPDPPLGRLPQVGAIVEQLSGGRFEGGGASMLVQWPRQDQQWALPAAGHIDGSFTKRDDWQERNWRVFSDESPLGPVEFVGAAGDLILWHCFLCHTGSANIGSVPRTGVFSRWHHLERETMRYDVPADLWKYWAI